MLVLKSAVVRCRHFLLEQHQFLYYLSVQNKVRFHLDASLFENKKQGIPPENTGGKPVFDDNVWIGPPHPVSQLRPKIFPDSTKLSKAEKLFYLESQKTQEWNQQYWEAHNKDFKESRTLFMDEIAKEKNLTRDEVAQSDDMCLFYERFLKINHKKHIAYNWNWYKKNLELLYLGAKANFSKLKRILTS